MRKKTNFICTIIFANDVTLTDEEFMAQQIDIDYELNEEFYKESRRVLDPDFAEHERILHRIERTEKRRAELLIEAEKIHKELLGLL